MKKCNLVFGLIYAPLHCLGRDSHLRVEWEKNKTYVVAYECIDYMSRRLNCISSYISLRCMIFLFALRGSTLPNMPGQLSLVRAAHRLGK